MVSIVGQESPLDLIGNIVGQGLRENLPRNIEKGYERGLGFNALNDIEKNLQSGEKDPFKIALQFAKAGVAAPQLERALGPLMNAAMTRSRVGEAYPTSGQSGISQPPNSNSGLPERTFGTPQNRTQTSQDQQVSQENNGQILSPPQPTPFAISSPSEIDARAKWVVNVMNDPNAYAAEIQNQNNLNNIAEAQRSTLENKLRTAYPGIGERDLARAMKVGSKFDYRNLDDWTENTVNAYDKQRREDKKLETAFIPGIGSALFGNNRQESLDNLGPVIRDKVANGEGEEVRKFLAGNFLTPTEINEQIYPVSKSQESDIKKLPQGLFPMNKKLGFEDVKNVFKGKLPKNYENPFVSYPDALARDPEGMKLLNDNLSNYFINNLNDKSSLLALRDKIIREKDYDWRQFGPALREAQKRGLKLSPDQQTELPEFETQAPYDSLPDIFKSLDRFFKINMGAR